MTILFCLGWVGWSQFQILAFAFSKLCEFLKLVLALCGIYTVLTSPIDEDDDDDDDDDDENW